MRFTIALALVIPGLILLATPALPVGIGLVWAGWWVFERSSIPEGDGLAAFVLALGALGVALVYGRFILERLTALP